MDSKDLPKGSPEAIRRLTDVNNQIHQLIQAHAETTFNEATEELEWAIRRVIHDPKNKAKILVAQEAWAQVQWFDAVMQGGEIAAENEWVSDADYLENMGFSVDEAEQFVEAWDNSRKAWKNDQPTSGE